MSVQRVRCGKELGVGFPALCMPSPRVFPSGASPLQADSDKLGDRHTCQAEYTCDKRSAPPGGTAHETDPICWRKLTSRLCGTTLTCMILADADGNVMQRDGLPAHHARCSAFALRAISWTSARSWSAIGPSEVGAPVELEASVPHPDQKLR